MSSPIRIIGSPLSPYVRKVLVVLLRKGLRFEVDPLIPFLGDDRFSALSPIRRIPVFTDDRVTLCDSTVIVEYLEERHPSPRLMPEAPEARARVRWIEEFADTRIGEVFIWRLYNQLAILPYVWGGTTDPEIVRRAREEEIPTILAYLESVVPEAGFLEGELTTADVALASFFRNAAFVRYHVDASRFPKVAGYVARVHATDEFVWLAPFENALIRTPPAGHRDKLIELGFPVTADTMITSSPRRGVMTI